MTWCWFLHVSCACGLVELLGKQTLVKENLVKVFTQFRNFQPVSNIFCFPFPLDSTTYQDA